MIMRVKFFSELYSLLEKVVPHDMLNATNDDDINYCLIHDFNDNVNQRMSVCYLSEGLVSIGTYFQKNGDTMCDPELIIKFSHESKTARVNSFYLSTVAIYRDFDLSDIGVEETSDEIDTNDYLRDYLKELVDRLGQNSDFFKKLCREK